MGTRAQIHTSEKAVEVANDPAELPRHSVQQRASAKYIRLSIAFHIDMQRLKQPVAFAASSRTGSLGI